MNKEVVLLLQKRANTSRIGKKLIIIITCMRKSVYLLKATPTNHTYTF